MKVKILRRTLFDFSFERMQSLQKLCKCAVILEMEKFFADDQRRTKDPIADVLCLTKFRNSMICPLAEANIVEIARPHCWQSHNELLNFCRRLFVGPSAETPRFIAMIWGNDRTQAALYLGSICGIAHLRRSMHYHIVYIRCSRIGEI